MHGKVYVHRAVRHPGVTQGFFLQHGLLFVKLTVEWSFPQKLNYHLHDHQMH